MSVMTKDVYTCDKCKTREFNLENGYEMPLEWMCIRMSSLTNCAGADDLHICAACKYEDLVTLWETI